MEEQDKLYESLLERCKRHPRIHYYGTQSNEVVRAALAQAHIFAYPSIWPETSCICLMEAMSAGCLCVHSNFAALFETAANWTWMYQFQEDFESHARALDANLAMAIENFWSDGVQSQLAGQKSYADHFYSWAARIPQWDGLLRGILTERNIRL